MDRNHEQYRIHKKYGSNNTSHSQKFNLREALTNEICDILHKLNVVLMIAMVGIYKVYRVDQLRRPIICY